MESSGIRFISNFAKTVHPIKNFKEDTTAETYRWCDYFTINFFPSENEKKLKVTI
jgi:hypothetical protein